MLRVTASYPFKTNARFDFDYYKSTHLEAFREVLGPAGIVNITIEKGVSGPEPGSKPQFVAVLNATIRDSKKFMELFAANAPRLMADVPNFTDITPNIQLGEVVVEK